MVVIGIVAAALGAGSGRAGPCPVSVSLDRLREESVNGLYEPSRLRLGILVITAPSTSGVLTSDIQDIDVRVDGAWRSQFHPGARTTVSSVTLMDLRYEWVAAPPDADAMRVRIAYWEPPGCLPFGIGSVRGVMHPPSSVAAWFQRRVKGLSLSFYRRLWPSFPPVKPAEWRVATYEIPLPKDVGEGTFPYAIAARELVAANYKQQ